MTNEEKVLAIREKLNIVNQGLLDPEKYKNANEEELTDIYDFVQSRERLSPIEVTAIADALGQLRHD
ncbi:TPA: DUF1128 family protein [Staphylococcus aureus]|nr:DUF1128 family protein [Staphylococcus aureus]HEE2153174.1 DUF1128 family protein [Staphylococcus aureus]